MRYLAAMRTRTLLALAVSASVGLLTSSAFATESAQSPFRLNGMSTAGQAAEDFLKRVPNQKPETWAGFKELPPAVQQNLRGRFQPLMSPLTPNVRTNTTAGDATGETQSEVSISADAQGHVVVAWNDSRGFTSPNTLGSSAYSCDFGATFTDYGNIPLITAGDNSYGDCTVTNDAHGNFYMATIYTTGSAQDVAVYKGTYTVGCPSTFTWAKPVICAIGPSGSNALDKPYIACDPAAANSWVYVTYSRFTTTTAIECVTSSNGATSFGAAVSIEIGGASGPYPSGSRPVVDKLGNLHLIWQGNGASGNVYCDLGWVVADDSIKYAKSTNHGTSFSTPKTIAPITVGANLGSGPGNFRDRLNSFPDFAVDVSNTPTAGYLHAIWTESATWSAPGNGTGVSVAEGNNTTNNTPGGATAFNIGDNLTGSLSATSDVDYFKVTLTAGQHLVAREEPQGFSCGVTNTTRTHRVRLYANPSITTTTPDSLLASSSQGGFCSEIHFDVKKTGQYILRVSSGGSTGTYVCKTRLLTYTSPNATTPARDTRDVVAVRSTDGGATWGPKVLVNSDAPANYDEEIPFICVDACGSVYGFWFDRRETETVPLTSFQGQWTDIYMGKSTNAGVSYAAGQRISDLSSHFNSNTLAVPNMGDYNAAWASGPNIYAGWSDERKTNVTTSGVDVYVDKFPSNCIITSIEVGGLLAEVGRGFVEISWTANVDGTTRFQLERSGSPGGVYVPVGDGVQAAGDGSYVARDASARPGSDYYYRLSYRDGGAVKYTNPVRVTTPRAVFALGAIRPNPMASHSTISYEIAQGGRATLEVYNLAGQRVRTLLEGNVLDGAGTVLFDGRDDSGRSLAAGAYFARLTSGGRSLTQRVMLLH